MKSIFIFSAILIFFSCDSYKIENKNQEEFTLIGSLKPLSPYVSDESVDLFLRDSWYTYDQANHIIWPNFRIYALKIDQQFYKFQIVDYYNEKNESGFYTIRVQEESSEEINIFSFEATACGNAFTNPNYENCLLNPIKNTFTYVNLHTGEAWKMSQFEAENRDDWHVAARGTDILLNSGTNGPGKVRASAIYLYDGFYPNKIPDYNRLSQESFGSKGLSIFNLSFELRMAPYALPAGQERVIFEEDWYQRRGPFHKSKPENWWVIKRNNSLGFAVFNVEEITEEQVIIDGEKRIQSYLKINSGPLNQRYGSWIFGPITPDQRLIRKCIDLVEQVEIECSSPKADIRFNALNVGKNRRWQINVQDSAVGPMSEEDLSNF